jgi:hypothetical protein
MKEINAYGPFVRIFFTCRPPTHPVPSQRLKRSQNFHLHYHSLALSSPLVRRYTHAYYKLGASKSNEGAISVVLFQSFLREAMYSLQTRQSANKFRKLADLNNLSICEPSTKWTLCALRFVDRIFMICGHKTSRSPQIHTFSPYKYSI